MRVWGPLDLLCVVAQNRNKLVTLSMSGDKHKKNDLMTWFVLHDAWTTKHDLMTADMTSRVVISTAYLQMMDGLHQPDYSRH